MSAGAFPAGTGGAGFDPVLVGSSAERVRPVAIRFEGSVRDFQLDDNFQYVACTPNEAAFAMGLIVQQGSIPSSIKTGNTLHEIEYLGGKNIEADVRNRVLTANPIARLLAQKSIAVKRIDVDVSGGQLKVAAYFADLDHDPRQVTRMGKVY